MTVTLDVSNHDLATFDAPCLRASGVTRIIIGCWDYAATQTILQRARAAGITVEDLYCYLYFGIAGQEEWEVSNALAIAKVHGGIKRVWIDVEADGRYEAAGMTPARRLAATRQAVEAVSRAGLQPGIYTYRSYWLNQMGNTTAFAHLPLWFANYGSNDPRGPRSPIRTVDFGGWGDIAAHQYSSTIVRCGRGRDHNYWYLEDGMSQEHIDRITRLERLIAGRGLQVKPGEENIGVLGWATGQPFKAGGPEVTLKAEAAMRYIDGMDWNFSLGLGNTQARVTELEKRVKELASRPADGTTRRDITTIVQELRQLADVLEQAAPAVNE